MQITREQQPSDFSKLKFDDAKNASNLSQEISAMDMLGMSWVYFDNPELYLVKPERRC
ncbi:hypothetical protein [Nitrosopumilus sp. S6]